MVTELLCKPAGRFRSVVSTCDYVVIRKSRKGKFSFTQFCDSDRSELTIKPGNSPKKAPIYVLFYIQMINLVSDLPSVTASVITVAALGDSVVLECKVEAYPEPKMLFWRDKSGRVPVIQGGKYNIQVQPSKDVSTICDNLAFEYAER